MLRTEISGSQIRMGPEVRLLMCGRGFGRNPRISVTRSDTRKKGILKFILKLILLNKLNSSVNFKVNY